MNRAGGLMVTADVMTCSLHSYGTNRACLFILMMATLLSLVFCSMFRL